MYIRVPYELTPRPYQEDALKALKNGKNCFLIVHRRAGKDVICMQMLLLRAMQRVGTHLYMAPMTTQIRQIIWKGLDADGRPFINAIPEGLIVKKNDARMELELINGIRIVFCGSNNISGVIGTNPVTIVYSEFSLHHPMARPYLNPILIQNGGVEIINTTPRGRNHCYDLYQVVKDNPKYFVQHLGVEETFDHNGTRIISDAQIQEARDMGMSDEMINQEFFCSFDSGDIGSYFTREMADMEREGRILPIKPNPNLPVNTCSDLGGTDSTSMWLFQLEGGYIHLLALLHDSGHGLKYYLEWADRLRKQWGCNWGTHFGPHDIAQKHQSWEQAESRLMQARKAGWHFQVTPKLDIEDGIEAMRYVFPKVKVNTTECELGIRAMREYRREYDEVNAVFKPKPLHNWASNPMDALRYLSINYRRLYDVPSPARRYEYKG